MRTVIFLNHADEEMVLAAKYGSSEELMGTFMRFSTSPQVQALLQWCEQPVDPVGNRIPNVRLFGTPLITPEIPVYSWSYEQFVLNFTLRFC